MNTLAADQIPTMDLREFSSFDPGEQERQLGIEPTRNLLESVRGMGRTLIDGLSSRVPYVAIGLSALAVGGFEAASADAAQSVPRPNSVMRAIETDFALAYEGAQDGMDIKSEGMTRYTEYIDGVCTQATPARSIEEEHFRQITVPCPQPGLSSAPVIIARSRLPERTEEHIDNQADEDTIGKDKATEAGVEEGNFSHVTGIKSTWQESTITFANAGNPRQLKELLLFKTKAPQKIWYRNK